MILPKAKKGTVNLGIICKHVDENVLISRTQYGLAKKKSCQIYLIS